MEAPPGTHTTLSGRYDLVEMVGFGGMAQVWRSYDRELRREVAVKVLGAHTADDPSSLQRFRREARHVAALSHPNIVPVYDFGVAEGRTYLVMEYIDGPSLRDLLAPAPLTSAATAQVAMDVLSALGHAHRRGIVHRDVKPANILLDTDGTARVADFGVARGEADTTELTAVGSFVGTATYASPEQFSGAAIAPASDLYSVGCVLYRCLVGRPPFEGDDPGQLVLRHRFADAAPVLEASPATPPAMAAAIERAMAKDPADRFPDAGSMAEALAPFAGAELGALVEGWTSGRVPPNRPGPATGTTETEGPGTPTEEGGPRPSPPSPLIRPSGDPATSSPGRRRLVVALIVVLALIGAGVLWGTVAQHPGSRHARSSALPSGGFLQPGQSIVSPNGVYRLTMQSDGNLVEYRSATTSPRWETGTSGNFGAYAVVQVDGDFVVYPRGKTAPPPGVPTPALWASGTFGHPGSSVALEDDGVVVIRAREHDTVLWTNR